MDGDAVFFESAGAFQNWLEQHHDQVKELWVGFYKKDADKKGITYQEAVDQALCFGWIDGVRKSVDESSYRIRFTPRKPKSNWSVVNIKRVEELSALGLMQRPGNKAFDERDQRRTALYSYERAQSSRTLDEKYGEQFRANQKAWDFFQAQPPSYQRVASWWVMSAKREETRLSRLATLIQVSENGVRLAILTGTKGQK